MTGARGPRDVPVSPDTYYTLISRDVSTYEVVAYVDALRTRNPKAGMWLYRST